MAEVPEESLLLKTFLVQLLSDVGDISTWNRDDAVANNGFAHPYPEWVLSAIAQSKAASRCEFDCDRCHQNCWDYLTNCVCGQGSEQPDGIEMKSNDDDDNT